jgi:hypothetical protein
MVIGGWLSRLMKDERLPVSAVSFQPELTPRLATYSEPVSDAPIVDSACKDALSEYVKRKRSA